MIGRYLAFALGTCLVAIVFAKTDRTSEGNALLQLGQGNEAGSPSQTEIETADWLAGDHTLRREIDGHFYAAANIGTTNIRMMVDTGASVIALTGDDARSAGLHWDDAEVRPIGTGASGAVYGVPARLETVEIGGMTRYNVAAVIIPEGLNISLLGQSYLSQIGSVEIADDRMVMSAQ